MAIPIQDFLKGIDPTGYTSISGAALGQLVDQAVPNTDKGLVISTDDLGPGVPQVPNATATTKWKNYLWRRVTATTTKLYMWNELAVWDANYLYWVEISLNVAAGSITNAMLAGSITSDKIISVAWSTLVGVPSFVGVATDFSGDVTGPYNATVIANDAVETAMILNLNVTAAKLAADAVETAKIKDLNVTTGKLADSAVTALKLATDAVETIKIKDDAVTADKIATDAVTADAILAGEVTHVKLANDAVEEANIKDGEVKHAKLAADAVENDNVKDGVLSAAKTDVFTDQRAVPAYNTVTTIAHGLGRLPTFVRGAIVNMSDEQGYAAGEEVGMEFVWFNSSYYNCYSVSYDATNIYVDRVNSNVAMQARKRSDHTNVVDLDPAKWNIKVVAW